MIEQENIFHLEVDNTAKAHMLETARWAKFLAILGFIGLGLVILIGLFAGTLMSSLSAYSGNTATATMGPMMFFIYLIIAGVYFYPVFALYKFSSLIKVALNSANQQQFNDAFRYMKSMFKYMGIVSIVILCIYGVVILAVVAGLSMR